MPLTYPVVIAVERGISVPLKWVVLGAAFFYVMALLQLGASKTVLSVGVLIAVGLATVARATWCRQQATVEFTDGTTIRLLRPRFGSGVSTASFQVKRFRAVRSYLIPGRHPATVLECITHSGGEALQLALRPAYGRPGFWSLGDQKPEDHPELARLRGQLSDLLGWQDDGFLGKRWPGAQVAMPD